MVELFGHDSQRELVAGYAAHFFRQSHEGEACVAIRFGDLDRNAVVGVHGIDCALVEIAPSEFFDAFDEELLLFGQVEVHRFLPPSSCLS